VAETIKPMAAQIDQQQLAEELVAQARAAAVQLIGEGGLLTGLTKSVLGCAVGEETPLQQSAIDASPRCVCRAG